MEDGILKLLNEKERAMLSDLHEGEVRKVLEKVLVHYQRHQATWTLANSSDHQYTLLARGKVEGSTFLIKVLEKAYKAEQKRRNDSIVK
jgi:hypothetical protein